jgi:hypothetical protein
LGPYPDAVGPVVAHSLLETYPLPAASFPSDLEALLKAGTIQLEEFSNHGWTRIKRRLRFSTDATLPRSVESLFLHEKSCSPV